MKNDNGVPPGAAGRPPSMEENGYRPKMGSVKRARERVEAGLPLEPIGGRKSTATDTSLGVQPLRPGGRAIKRRNGENGSSGSPSPVSSPDTQPSPPLPSSTRKANPAAIGAAISKPATFQQWPLKVENSGASRKLNNSPTREEARMTRLSDLQPPSLPGSLDSRVSSFRREDFPSRPNTYASTTSFAQTPPPLWDENLPTPKSGLYAPMNTPSQSSTYLPSTNSTSSRPSTTSSAGTIPEFPVPGTVPLPVGLEPVPRPRKSLGPPSSRRGYSSYYSVSSFTPIPEEGIEMPRSHISYASSHAIPTSWGSNPAQYNYDTEGELILDEDYATEDGQLSRGGPDDEERGLVRHASMGTRHRPSLTTIRSFEREDLPEIRHPPPQTTPRSLEELRDRFKRTEPSKKNVVGRNAVAAGATGAALAVGLGASREGHIPVGLGVSGTGGGASRSGALPMAGTMTSNNQPTALTTDIPVTASSGQPRGFNQPPNDPRADSGWKGYGRWGRRDPRAPPQAATYNRQLGPSGGVTELRPPPRVTHNSEKDAERQSVTSLPDLIRRATTLATVLEKDKGRPISRFDVNGLGDGKDERNPSPPKRSGSITDILASFPPPGLNSPRDGSRSRGSRTDSRWPSPLYSTPLNSSTPAYVGSTDGRSKEPEVTGKGRKCCGLPLWAIWLLIIGTLVVSAAVIVPVALIVLPRQRQNGGTAALATCQKEKKCENGGTNTVDGGRGCHCSCAPGFTGDTCATPSGNGCVTSDIDSDGKKISGATLGSSIPRLLQVGPTTFRIPLNASQIISVFSTTKISCGSENALVTFDGRSDRGTGKTRQGAQPSTPRRVRRQDPAVVTAAASQPSVATSNGIVFAQPTATTPLAQAPSATPTGSPFIIDEDTLDFARVSVLYILQQKNLDSAVSAQQSLQTFLGANPTDPGTKFGAGISIDFQKFTLDLGNGKVGAGT